MKSIPQKRRCSVEEHLSLIIDAEFAKVFSGETPVWLISEKRVNITAENLRIFINNYIDRKEEMMLNCIEEFKKPYPN